MKKCLFLVLLFVSINTYSQKYTLLEINAKWNSNNNITKKSFNGIPIKFGWLEDQPKTIQEKILAVPTLVLMKDGKLIHRWQAGIDFRLNITDEEFKEIYYKLK